MGFVNGYLYSLYDSHLHALLFGNILCCSLVVLYAIEWSLLDSIEHLHIPPLHA